MKLAAGLLLASSFLLPAYADTNPFLGRWNFNISANRASWLGVTEKGGALEVWYQPTGGNVFQVKDVQRDGSHMVLKLSNTASWTLDAKGDRLVGTQKRGEETIEISGMRAPALKRAEPKSWGKPEALFNGKDLTGWAPLGKPENSHWVVKDGFLLNESKGANLASKRKFDDFKLHFEVNYPEEANSGFYLRGRYEIQLESEGLSHNPPERRIGSIYGRITPKGDLPRKTGVWDTFDVTLVGRTVTVVRNGVTTIDHQEIEGITGGALDANEAEPGPFYIQGDHTGGLKFRNITVSLPKY